MKDLGPFSQREESPRKDEVPEHSLLMALSFLKQAQGEMPGAGWQEEMVKIAVYALEWSAH